MITHRFALVSSEDLGHLTGKWIATFATREDAQAAIDDPDEIGSMSFVPRSDRGRWATTLQIQEWARGIPAIETRGVEKYRAQMRAIEVVEAEYR